MHAGTECVSSKQDGTQALPHKFVKVQLHEVSFPGFTCILLHQQGNEDHAGAECVSTVFPAITTSPRY